MKPTLLQLSAWFLAALLPLRAAGATTATPNIIVILSDDYGYGSAGCYGANPALVRTPNIDRLATEGRRFTDANTTSSVCAAASTTCGRAGSRCRSSCGGRDTRRRVRCAGR